MWGSSVRIRSGPPKLEIAAVKTAAISHLTTEIPQTDFCFDHLTDTPSRECPSFLFSAAQNLRGFLRNPGYDGDPASAYDHFMRRAMFLQRIEEDLSSRALNILLSFKLLNPAEPHFPPRAADHLAQGRRNLYGVLCVMRLWNPLTLAPIPKAAPQRCGTPSLECLNGYHRSVVCHTSIPINQRGRNLPVPLIFPKSFCFVSTAPRYPALPEKPPGRDQWSGRSDCPHQFHFP